MPVYGHEKGQAPCNVKTSWNTSVGCRVGVGMLRVFCFYGFIVLWFCAFRVLGFWGFMVLWFHGFMVLWFYGCMAFCFYGFTCSCFYGFMVLCFRNLQLVISCFQEYIDPISMISFFVRSFLIFRCPFFPNLAQFVDVLDFQKLDIYEPFI